MPSKKNPKEPLVVQKGAVGANARIMKAVKTGRGWRYHDESSQKKRLVTPGGLGPKDILRRRKKGGKGGYYYVSAARSKRSKKMFKQNALEPGSKRRMAELRKIKNSRK